MYEQLSSIRSGWELFSIQTFSSCLGMQHCFWLGFQGDVLYLGKPSEKGAIMWSCLCQEYYRWKFSRKTTFLKGIADLINGDYKIGELIDPRWIEFISSATGYQNGSKSFLKTAWKRLVNRSWIRWKPMRLSSLILLDLKVYSCNWYLEQ